MSAYVLSPQYSIPGRSFKSPPQLLVHAADPRDPQTLASIALATRVGCALFLVAPDLEPVDESLDGGDDGAHETPRVGRPNGSADVLEGRSHGALRGPDVPNRADVVL